jgi:hypothetical protein
LAVIGAGLVLVGFVLPWFTCNLTLLSGSFSGLGALIQLVVGLVLALAGTAGSRSSDLNALGGIVTVLLLVVMAVVALTPIMGLRIGRQGLALIQALRTSNDYRRSAARAIARSAGIGLAPLLCYFSTAVTNLNLPALPGLGSSVRVQSADIGLWITMGGFGLALVAGLVISVAASLAEQLPKSPSSPISNSPPRAEVSTPAPTAACPKCGASFQAGDQFCTTCGTRLTS